MLFCPLQVRVAALKMTLSVLLSLREKKPLLPAIPLMFKVLSPVSWLLPRMLCHYVFCFATDASAIAWQSVELSRDLKDYDALEKQLDSLHDVTEYLFKLFRPHLLELCCLLLSIASDFDGLEGNTRRLAFSFLLALTAKCPNALRKLPRIVKPLCDLTMRYLCNPEQDDDEWAAASVLTPATLLSSCPIALALCCRSSRSHACRAHNCTQLHTVDSCCSSAHLPYVACARRTLWMVRMRISALAWKPSTVSLCPLVCLHLLFFFLFSLSLAFALCSTIALLLASRYPVLLVHRVRTCDVRACVGVRVCIYCARTWMWRVVQAVR